MNPQLAALGFDAFFAAQLSAEEIDEAAVARVVEVQRSGLILADGDHEWPVAFGARWFEKPAEDRPTVGDWVVLDESRQQLSRLLDRKSLIKRGAAGERAELQPIAANVDTLFIVSSCNDDFNESRIERYLALALEANVYPVVVLTKADLATDTVPFLERATGLGGDAPVEIVNALDEESLAGAMGWVSPGATVALVGSSGVGKSTIVNTIAGEALAATRGIREKDSKGRHTTTSRSLYRLPGGGLLLDVPGMRELKVADAAGALSRLFEDIETLAKACRFGDCRHSGEPGCAVLAAVEDGRLARRRLDNYFKLEREEAYLTEAIHDRRRRERAFGRVVRDAIASKRDKGSSR